MIAMRSGTRVWLAAGDTDMRCGIDSLAVKVQTVLSEDPYAGHVFAFRGRRGGLVKLLWSDGDGMCLLTKRLERGHFVWPQADTGSVALSAAQLSMLLEGIPLSRLLPSAFNVRKSGGEDVGELAALIKTQGLLQNLVVHPIEAKRGKPTGDYGVAAVGRRLRALGGDRKKATVKSD